MLVGIIFALVTTQLALFFFMAIGSVPEKSTADDGQHSSRNFAKILKRLGNLEQQITRLSRLQIVKTQPENISQGSNAALPTQPPQPAPQIAPSDHSDHSDTGPDYLIDRNLSLYLEPVVELATMQTMFYRAELAFQSQGLPQSLEVVRILDMADQIAKGGDSAAMDMKLLSRLGPVITKLSQKGRLAGVICPMSEHSFSNQKFLEELTRYLKHHPELARVLVIEISQANLAGLSKDGMTGLAFLAQIGATFCLGGAGLESPDLDSLSSLGFRYFDLDYDDNIARYGLSAFNGHGLAVTLRDQARAANIQLIGSGLAHQSQQDALHHILKLGRGTIFSRPRLVRANFAKTTGQAKAA